MKRIVLVLLCGTLIVVGAAMGYAQSIRAHGQVAMSPMGGMMGGGMMGSGMMGGTRPNGGGGAPSDNSGSLGSYIQSQGLSCMSCHAMAGNGLGPPFTDIARRYKGQAHAKDDLANSIANGVSGRWQGYPPMPGGLASPSQAAELARLILDLAR